MIKKYTLHFLFTLIAFSSFCQDHSVARLWNEALLEGIRNDFARPTVHARNLFHLSAAAYDAWAAYDDTATTYFLGKSHGDYYFEYLGVEKPDDIRAAQEEAISYACYRLMQYRFRLSPGKEHVFEVADHLMDSLGYDKDFESEDYESGDPAALGNYIAAQVIRFGWQDGANELGDFENIGYEPVNTPLVVSESGSQGLLAPNRWQPLAFDVFIDQSGNPIPGSGPSFLSPEWGRVLPFSLKKEDLTIYERDGFPYWVYHDPGPPPYISLAEPSTDYQWGFSLVSTWSAHLDPFDGVMWDISPGSIGNLDIDNFPRDYSDYPDFYDYLEGGDPSPGYSVNPKTGLPYEPQLVPRGDYTRVLAEFWADGPDSETPPGHWFTILNYVNDHPEFERKFAGEGEPMDPLEWEIKTYFALGGAMHDVAITAWGIKGYYDYIRPISSIRFMAERGQSVGPSLPNYHPEGIPLVDGFIEQVQEGDTLAGPGGENVGKIKVFAWKGHDYVEDPETDMAGVGWILAENWMPYQRPTFVTPPFAGYVSGHSTYSRAAAELLTLLTGDEYFPGGMGEFQAPMDEFLVFEKGPSQDVVLQWAKYQDASDQCSLSRIWGGIHPPQDDIPGRIIGETIGKEAYVYALKYFENDFVSDTAFDDEFIAFPNPVRAGNRVFVRTKNNYLDYTYTLHTIDGKILREGTLDTVENQDFSFDTSRMTSGFYVLTITSELTTVSKLIVVN